MADYQYAFDSAVYSVTAMGNPPPINTDINSDGWGGTFPVSAANNSFVLLSAGKINHEQVEGVLFNYVAAASSAPIAGDGVFYLDSPGGPDHPDLNSVSIVSLSTNKGVEPGNSSLSGTMFRLESTAGNLSTFYGVPSSVAADNTGYGGANNIGSALFSITGTNTQVLRSLEGVINNLAADGAFKADLAVPLGQMEIEQRTGGANGNTTMFVSGGAATTALSSVININSTFQGGADERSDATHIRAAGNGTAGGYDGAVVAVVTTTGRTATYTLDHGGSIAIGISGFNVATGPNMRREVLLGYR